MTYEEEADAIIRKLRYTPVKYTPEAVFMSASIPVAPKTGQLWLDTASYTHRVYDGAVWVTLSWT